MLTCSARCCAMIKAFLKKTQPCMFACGDWQPVCVCCVLTVARALTALRAMTGSGV